MTTSNAQQLIDLLLTDPSDPTGDSMVICSTITASPDGSISFKAKNVVTDNIRKITIRIEDDVER